VLGVDSRSSAAVTDADSAAMSRRSAATRSASACRTCASGASTMSAICRNDNPRCRRPRMRSNRVNSATPYQRYPVTPSTAAGVSSPILS
jgi:hypothetical protein